MSHPAVSLAPNPSSSDEASLVAALRQGDETAFTSLVEHYHAALVRLAMVYVSDRAVAEDVAQETWLGVLRGLSRFEGRSSLKTWIFTILANRAKTRAQRERRTLPFSALEDPEADEPSVAPERFLPSNHPQWPDEWAENPNRWANLPEERLLSQETRACIQQAIEALPPTQRQVITLRDIEGWASGEVCNVLEISETNQRVSLHRARSKVRLALEWYFIEEPP
jgi:RNA polymerase sigma-70 factor (ECF subfamily)